jgi:hypothetical protein
MSDQRLREAQLRQEFRAEIMRGYQAALCNSDVPGWTLGDEVAKVADNLLAAHPVEPASERLWPADAYPEHMAEATPDRRPSDAAVEAARAAREQVVRSIDRASDGTDWPDPMRAALEAAYRVDVPRPLLDREAVRQAIADELDSEGVVVYGLTPKLTDVVMRALGGAARLMADQSVTDEAVEAAARTLNPSIFEPHTYVDPEPMRDVYRADARAALAAAAPLLAPGQVLDREAVWRGVYSAAIQHLNPSGVADKATDAVMELARPMPTREQIAEALREVSVLDYAAPPAENTLSGSERERVADALLALLNGSES